MGSANNYPNVSDQERIDYVAKESPGFAAYKGKEVSELAPNELYAIHAEYDRLIAEKRQSEPLVEQKDSRAVREHREEMSKRQAQAKEALQGGGVHGDASGDADASESTPEAEAVDSNQLELPASQRVDDTLADPEAAPRRESKAERT